MKWSFLSRELTSVRDLDEFLNLVDILVNTLAATKHCRWDSRDNKLPTAAKANDASSKAERISLSHPPLSQDTARCGIAQLRN
jgi:hypothetical protein